MNYYNENDPFAAQWLRNLIQKKLIPNGEVDERDIQNVEASDLHGYTQCHFFAGIGGWSYALELAGWPDDRPVWTGSCPCQSFSNSGSRSGASDSRHLWPDWFRLIRECKPSAIFGEQVASAIAFGWLDTVATDLEAENYAVAATVLGAHSVCAPHQRQRLWFVANVNVAATTGQRPHRRTPQPVFGVGHLCEQLEGSSSDVRDGWPTEPDVGRLAHGGPARVGRLRALGNAIVPQVAAQVIRAYMHDHAA